VKITIRQEIPDDFKEVSDIIEDAFQNEEISDNTEHRLVERLRNSEAFIPELSLVAVNGNEIVGHILLTRIKIESEKKTFDSLALAPVTVKPVYQKKGIGGLLIRESHRIAKEMGFKSIILLGHEDYYPRFGYELTSKYGIKIPFDAPEKNCMAIELVEDGLKGISGTVEYAKEFYE